MDQAKYDQIVREWRDDLRTGAAFVRGRTDLVKRTEFGRVSKKFSDRQIREIRSSPDCNIALAVEHGVDESTIARIKRRKIYSYVPDIEEAAE